MITRIKISGFKSFQDFEMSFAPFTIVVGINAAGKSNLFDAIRLLSDIANADLEEALNKQRGNPFDLFSKFSEGEYASQMSFEVDMILNAKVSDKWGSEVSIKQRRLTYSLTLARAISNTGYPVVRIQDESLRSIASESDSWLQEILSDVALYARLLSFQLYQSSPAQVTYIETIQSSATTILMTDNSGIQKERPTSQAQQTILSSINSVDYPHGYAAKQEMHNWRFLVLNPDELRAPSPINTFVKDSISETGKNLAAALAKLKKENSEILRSLSRKLNSFFPNFLAIDVVETESGSSLAIQVQQANKTWMPASALSEGTLRVLALCILAEDDDFTGLICLEEPENGIHPFRIGETIDLLSSMATDWKYPFYADDGPFDSLRQVIVNTHSPLFLSQITKRSRNHSVAVWYFRNVAIAVRDKNGNALPFRKTKASQINLDPAKKEALNDTPDQKLLIDEVNRYLRANEDLESATN